MHYESNYDSPTFVKDNLGILGLATLFYQSTGLQYSMLAIKQKT